jgi:predicted neutral ceramidase superfamily lipid hydrolase
MMSENSRAVEALEKIAEHEKECAARWAEVAVELRELNQKAHTHAARWEKLAWFVVITVTGSMISIFMRTL